MGVGKDGEPTENFQLGMELLGKYTVFAEGARHLGKQVIARYKLGRRARPADATASASRNCGRSTRAPPARLCDAHRRLADGQATYGGAFLYHLEGNKVTLGFITGLDYSNPYLSPFEEFQRWKTPQHPLVPPGRRAGRRPGKRLSYGARAITAGRPGRCRRPCSRAARWWAVTRAS